MRNCGAFNAPDAGPAHCALTYAGKCGVSSNNYGPGSHSTTDGLGKGRSSRTMRSLIVENDVEK